MRKSHDKFSDTINVTESDLSRKAKADNVREISIMNAGYYLLHFYYFKLSR